jgi:DNA adenine methylase
MRYQGGKGKCFQQLINLMPPHHTYIESHLGGGAVMRHKKPAHRSIGIDVDPAVIEMWQGRSEEIELVESDAVAYLSSFEFEGKELVYLDPPYLPSTRLRQRVYRYDYDEKHHEALLELVCMLPCMVMISGYDNALYDQRLAGWNKVKFKANSQSGLREECVWFNFERTSVLHDAGHLGATFRERQAVKRRRHRMHERIERMDPAERSALMSWMVATYGEDRTE